MINKLNKKFAFKIFKKEFCLILRIYLIKIYGNWYAIDIGVLEFSDIDNAIEYIYIFNLWPIFDCTDNAHIPLVIFFGNYMLQGILECTYL